MNKKQSRVISLVILALFICLVSLANRAQAGGGGSQSDAVFQTLLRGPGTQSNPNQ